MRIKRLELENFRGFKKAAVDFPKGNVAVFFGWNGAGKTAVLDAVAIILSEIADRKITYGLSLGYDDIRSEEKTVRVSGVYILFDKEEKTFVQFSLGESPVRYVEALDLNEALKKDLYSSNNENLPVIAYYKTNRELNFAESDIDSQLRNLNGRKFAYHNAISAGINDFQDFVAWFRYDEDKENEDKIEKQDLKYESPRLKTIRRSVSEFLSKLNVNFAELKVRRQSNGEIDFSKPSQKFALVVQKAGQELKLTQLSSGERSLILLVADIARRAAILNPHLDDPLQSEGVVLIDEIELHLHPKWQRAVIPALSETFPNIQFIIATHSPQVLSQVENGAVFEIDNFQIHQRNTYGRDNNWLLHVIMEDDERPEVVQAQLEEYFSLVRTGQLEAAAKLRRQIEQQIGADEPEFAKADVLLRKKERSLAP